jgi:hypothetical protein
MSQILASETGMMFVDNKEAQFLDRKLFVYNLGELLKQTREGVVGAELDNKEIVTVTYRDGSTQEINVNMDSYMAIIRDVAKHI